MNETLANLAGSKKAVVFGVAIVAVAFSAKLGLDSAALDLIGKLTMAYLGAQGIADFGKHRASSAESK